MDAACRPKFLREALAFAASVGLEVIEVTAGGRHYLMRCRRPGGGAESVAVHRGTKNRHYVERALRAQIRAVARGTYAEQR